MLFVFILYSSIMFLSGIKLAKESGKQPEQNSNPDVFTIQKNKKVLKINESVGKVFEIQVKGSDINGYRWYLLNTKEIDQTTLKILPNTYVADRDRHGLPLAGGTYHFGFLALKPTQNLELKFAYKRAWGGENAMENTFKVNIS